jgi:hypothetical protein
MDIRKVIDTLKNIESETAKLYNLKRPKDISFRDSFRPYDTYMVDRYMEQKMNSEPTNEKDANREFDVDIMELLSEDEADECAKY